MKNKSIHLISKIKEIYAEGGNIIKYLKNHKNSFQNSIEDILISYDFQSGTYIEYAKENSKYISEYTSAVANVINKLETPHSILEVGVGECTTLANVIGKIENKNAQFLGFDISWSRIHCGIKYLTTKGVKAKLFVGDLFNIPLASSSIDVVYTSHSIEPNGGREKEALIELFRITKKYLILLEPANEFATEQGKERMIENGYIQNLKSIILELGMDLIEYRKFDVFANELNPTGLYVIKKKNDANAPNNLEFFCPISKSPLHEFDDHFFSEESLLSFPKINKIPCLYESYGILTSKHNC